MALQFGTKKKDAPAPTGKYLRKFKKGETIARFLVETDDFIDFREHRMPDGKWFPCTKDRETCPGCNHPDEKVQIAKRKYATNVYVPQFKNVTPYLLPVSVVDKLVIRAERNGGTIVNRDYAVIRSGDGLDTEYDVDQEDKYDLDLNSLRAQGEDIEEILAEAYIAVWGSLDYVHGDAPKVERVVEKDDDIPPTDARAGADQEYTLSALRAMTKSQIQQIAIAAGIDWTEDDTKTELIEKLFDKDEVKV